MRPPPVRFTARRLLVAVSVSAVALASLPEPALVLPLPTFMISPVTLPDGTTVMPASVTLYYSRWGVALMVYGLLVVALTGLWLVKRLLRTARRLVRPDEPGAPPALPFPRVRFTVRRMMVLVATCAVILGIVCGLASRSAKLAGLAAYHHDRIEEPYFHASFDLGHGPPDRISPRDSWRLEMTLKYRHAAQYPWLPVAPDPAEPE
jgi:hypothetical protein